MEEKIGTSITDITQKELGLLGRHLDVLKAVKEQGPIGIIRLSQITAQPQHMIRYSLRTLEREGIIVPSPQGAIITEKAQDTLDNLLKNLDEIQNTVMNLKTKLK
jgi:predicted transcriptional regulator